MLVNTKNHPLTPIHKSVIRPYSKLKNAIIKHTEESEKNPKNFLYRRVDMVYYPEIKLF